MFFQLCFPTTPTILKLPTHNEINIFNSSKTLKIPISISTEHLKISIRFSIDFAHLRLEISDLIDNLHAPPPQLTPLGQGLKNRAKVRDESELGNNRYKRAARITLAHIEFCKGQTPGGRNLGGQGGALVLFRIGRFDNKSARPKH